MATRGFSQNGLYNLTVDARLESQDSGRKTSTIYWEMVVHRPPNPDWWAWSTTNMGNRARVWDGANGQTLWENPNIAYDFRSGAVRWVFASGYRTIQHRPDGTGEYNISGDMNLINIGYAFSETGWRSLPRLARVPDAPTPLFIDWINNNSLRYVFSGNWDGGAPIREWQALWQENDGPQIGMWSNGTAFLQGIKPATRYTFWSRGRNDVGWGPWSSPMSAYTKAGATVKHAGTWRDAVPYVKHQGEWRAAEPWVKQNGVWKRAGL